MTATTINPYLEKIRELLPRCLTETHFAFGKKYRGKVRDTYDLGDQLLLITTDRLTAFDRELALIPCKGQVLNLVSAWWFEQTSHLVPNHLIAIPDPNVIIAKKCRVFPIEFVVRGYVTGTTGTSIWTLYQQGQREFGGHHLVDGLTKNQALAMPILTPTTKEATHDRPITPNEIVAEGWMSQADWDEASHLALTLYQAGVKKAAEHGLILVDTKYEFGRDASQQIIVVDEIHTPDSSRYWLQHSYEDRVFKGLEPENIDKEFLRLWFAQHCDPYHDEVLPQAPQALVETLASRYIQLYEMITGRDFHFPCNTAKNSSAQGISIEQRIMRNVAGFLR
jgi:phosphoribosylaminoimidazole-succinocarboxamide synthase